MKREEFLRMLARALHKLKKAERERYLESYRELIADMTEGGMTEEEAVEKQGDVRQIAQEILENAAPSEKKGDIRGILLAAASVFLLGSSLRGGRSHRHLCDGIRRGQADGVVSGNGGCCDGDGPIFCEKAQEKEIDVMRRG